MTVRVTGYPANRSVRCPNRPAQGLGHGNARAVGAEPTVTVTTRSCDSGCGGCHGHRDGHGGRGPGASDMHLSNLKVTGNLCHWQCHLRSESPSLALSLRSPVY